MDRADNMAESVNRTTEYIRGGFIASTLPALLQNVAQGQLLLRRDVQGSALGLGAAGWWFFTTKDPFIIMKYRALFDDTSPSGPFFILVWKGKGLTFRKYLKQLSKFHSSPPNLAQSSYIARLPLIQLK